jgi:hypothetical protein
MAFDINTELNFFDCVAYLAIAIHEKEREAELEGG